MGRRRSIHFDLLPGLYRRVKNGLTRYYYGPDRVALGSNYTAAVQKVIELRGELATPAATFADAARDYRLFELAKKAPKTQDEYDRQLSKLVAVFGRLPLASIKPSHIARFLGARPRIAGTREKALLSAVINFARARGDFDGANPCAGIRGAKARRTRLLTRHDLTAIYVHADRLLCDFLDLAWLTGQRPSDVLRMRRSDVQDGALGVRQAKTGAMVRIAVIGPLAAVLERLAARSVASLYLVADDRGQRVRLAAIQRRFRAACIAAGVQDAQVRDIRRSAGTAAGDLRAAQLLLGHASEATTAAVYRATAGVIAQPLMEPIVNRERNSEPETTSTNGRKSGGE